MIYGAKELANAFRTVRKNTIQIAEDIPESKYTHVAAPEVRSVAQILAHIAVAPRVYVQLNRPGLTSMVGIDFLAMIEPIRSEESKHRTKAEVIELLRTEGDIFASWLENASPEFLAETVTEPDGKTVKTRFERLLHPKEHEMHHRGQLMLIERQLGIVPHLTRQFAERMAQMQAARAQQAPASATR